MSNDTTIIFYDIPYAEPNICWSSNTWKTRFCLNYKRLPYKTQWVEYPDIESTCIKIGAAPTDVKEDGITPEYTFPVIYDPTTQRAISESFNIAIYLDTTYPDTPRVFSPTHTQSLHSAFDDLITRRTFPHVGMRIRQLVFERLPHGRSQEYFRRTRESWFGKKIEEFGPRTEEERIRKWSDFEKY